MRTIAAGMSDTNVFGTGACVVKVRAWLAVLSLCVSVAGLAGDEARVPVSRAPVTGSPAPEMENPTTLLWYTHPAATWDDALPVGNGRLGGMVFGRVDAEEIGLNEDTYWSGGPYSTTVKGAHAMLPEVQQLIFAGDF